MKHEEHKQHGESPVVPAHTPFVRTAELADIQSAIDNEDCQAVILRYDTGQGASSILRRLAGDAGSTRAVMALHGTPSLSSVPYGALAPLLGEMKGDEVSLRTTVFRAVLAAMERNGGGLSGSGRRSLVIVDDAHAIDPATAELLVTLVLSGTIQLVASHRRNSRLPEPLPRLWSSGSAETLELGPLSREQGHEFCRAVLGAPVALPASWYFWSRSRGNPMLLKILLGEALDNGLLTQSRGTWVYHLGRRRVGRTLRDAVRQQIRGLSDAAEMALDLVALAEPISREVVEQVSGVDAVAELLGRSLIQEQRGVEPQLQLANPIYGEVIRQMVPPARSRILHDSLLGKLQAHPSGTDALLRRVSWAVDSGLEVSTDQLMRAALIACKLSQPTLALELLDHINGQDLTLRVRAVQARAHYMVGRYEQAAELLEDAFDQAESLDELLFGSLLRATTRLALGMPAASMEKDVARLLAAGERLKAAQPEQAATITEHVAQKAMLLELMKLSLDGDYGRMLPLITSVLSGGSGLSMEERRLNESIALAMDAERLCALGLASQSQARSAEAFAIEHSEVHDVFFIPEMIVFRQLTTALCSGDLNLAAKLLDQFFVDTGPVIITFGGGANVARGMGLIRQGQLGEALEALLPGIESLRDSDPQQLLGFCISMAAYAAAKLGRQDVAAGLIAEHRERPAMFLVTAHERAFMAAAREYQTHDGAGLAELQALAGSARIQQAPLLELNALAMAVELGDLGPVDRLLQICPTVEGAWSESILQICQRLHSGTDGAGPGPAAARLPKLKDAAQGRTTVFGTLPLLPHQLGAATGPSVAQGMPAKSGNILLTRREREITALVVEGFSDKEIAERLQLSVRTVEGHLYRCYAKMSISGRHEIIGHEWTLEPGT
ncbi:LuxR C-terminal-related transcriptional regulator [Arthrobacter sp. HY1533]|uniref:LuxR C-terminal-related transcriptional regulator n=1 Tax=Arthrobacter sp. HY1533 TaxID=2970919 RepID=UPI0022B9D7BE|nr:LuxR family transcriptional regulator [Arthrobacter sp. HY1533]